MICLGSWPSTYKASRWHFELYYFDFALGFLIAAVILAFTAGSMGFDGFSFLDDLQHSGKHQLFDAFAAGVVFNLGNMLLMAAISVSGMALAFPISAGVALIVGIMIGWFKHSIGNPLLTFGGCALIFLAMLLASAAYRFLAQIRHEARAKAGKTKSTRRPAAVKGIVLAVLSGALVSWLYPTLRQAMEGEAGLGPYSICALLALGVFFSTFIFNLFFMNLPVEGEPVDFMEYFSASPAKHAWAIFGGILWCAGLLFALAVSSAETIHVAAYLRYGFSQAFTLVAILWGAFVWKEFRDGDARVKSLASLMFLLFGLGVALVSMAQTLIVRPA
jgi:glucose uptake protein